MLHMLYRKEHLSIYIYPFYRYTLMEVYYVGRVGVTIKYIWFVGKSIRLLSMDGNGCVLTAMEKIIYNNSILVYYIL